MSTEYGRCKCGAEANPSGRCDECSVQPGPGDVIGQYIADCKRDHEPEDERAAEPMPRTLFVLELEGDVLSSHVNDALKRAGFRVLGDTTAYALDPERDSEEVPHQHDRPDECCRCCGNITSYGYNDDGHCEACAEDLKDDMLLDDEEDEDEQDDDEDTCTCCRHWRSACASERQHGGASACRATTCEGCNGGED